MAVTSVTDMLKIGIDNCRKGDWNEGLRNLGMIAAMGDEAGKLPGIFYSYLGYGIARKEKRIQEGLKLCRHSIEVEFFQAENYLNLARTYLLAKDRKNAVHALRAGLKIDRGNKALLALYRDLGVRKKPVLPFLSRSNVLNQFLGRLRHSWLGSK